MRLKALTRMSDLFLVGSGRFADDRPQTYDDILRSLIDTIEAHTAARTPSRAPQRPAHPDRLMTRSDVAQLSLAAGRRRPQRRGARNFGQDVSNEDRLLQTGLYQTIARHDFMKLLGIASAEVRARMVADNPRQPDINTALADIIARISDGVRDNSVDHARAIARIKRLQRTAQFREADLHAYASANEFELTAVALTAFGDFRIDFVERALLDPSTAMILILARTAELCRTTVRAILTMPAADRRLTAIEVSKDLRQFEQLRLATARSALEFYRLRRHADPKPHVPTDLTLQWYVQSIPVRPAQA